VTLVELVVGLTVASALLAAGYAGLTTALDRREAAVTVLEADLEALATRSALREWLEGTRMVSESNAPLFSGADALYEDISDDQISFLTTGLTPLGTRIASVRVFVDRDPETPETGLVADFAAWLGTERIRMELLPEATGLEVRYRSALLAGRTWHPSWFSSSVLPAGVELTVLGDVELHPLLAAPIRVALVGGR
jgi:type II secretory pathway pseudopilin PulG